MSGPSGGRAVFPVAKRWPIPIRDWFCKLLAGNPQKPAEVSLTEWRSWLQSAERHGISSLIFSQLRTIDSAIQPPAEIFTALRMAYFEEVARIMVRRSQLDKLLIRFEKVDIKTLVLKGSALGEMMYQDVFQRPTADIDILVSKSDYNKARTVLLEYGYRSKRGDRSLQMDWSCDEEFMPAVIDENRQYVVELHWALTSHAQLLEKIETEQLFGRAEFVPGLKQPLSVLSSVDALTFACLHLFYKHINELRLIWLYDIHLIAEQIERMDLWHETIDQSQQWQGRLALKNCLELARDWFGTTFPEIVSDLTYKPASAEENQLFNLVIFQLEHGPRQGWLRKHIFQMSHLKGWNKVHYLKSRLFPSRQEIEANYPGLRVWPGPLVHIGRLAMMLVSKK